MIDTGLAGRTALITGANNPEGIGVAIGRALLRVEARVFVTGYRPEETVPPREGEGPGPARYRSLRSRPVGEVVEALGSLPGEIDGLEWDLAGEDVAGPLFDRVEERFGPVEVLVNNAAHWHEDSFTPGAAGETRISRVTGDSHDRHFAVNSRAPALLMAEFARRHRERGSSWGRIVNVSTDGASGHAGAVSYAASKHALESYSRAAAWEFGRLGITVNVVAPGPVQTGWIPSGMEESLREEIPLGRIGEPSDVADAVVFLASEQARWITGQLLYVGGGHVMPP